MKGVELSIAFFIRKVSKYMDILEVKIKDMVLGQTVCVPMKSHSKFRYPIYEEVKVIRLTPKKTRVKLSNNISYTQGDTKFFIPNEETRRQTEIARKYEDIMTVISVLCMRDYRKLDDDSLDKLYELLVNASDILKNNYLY